MMTTQQLVANVEIAKENLHEVTMALRQVHPVNQGVKESVWEEEWQKDTRKSVALLYEFYLERKQELEDLLGERWEPCDLDERSME